MIVTEHGLRFRREGDRWQCVEHPELFMLSGAGLFIVTVDEDRTFRDLNEALACLKRNRAVE